MRRSSCNRLPARGSRLHPPGYRSCLHRHVDGPGTIAPSARRRGERMASDMREAAYREGGVTVDGLKLLGYTAAQIAAHADAARIIADQQAAMT
jgi:hypothetical protein